MHINELKTYSKIAILGYGVEGQSTYNFLRQHQTPPHNITILDQKEEIEIPDNSQAQTGSSFLDSIDTFDLIFLSPGITQTKLLKRLPNKTLQDIQSMPFTSQAQIFFDNYTGISVGITGTKGKSTIATLAYLTLQEAGKDVVLVGNVGKPVLDIIDRDNPPSYVIYELSSFMLESLKQFTLDIAVCNTIYKTHTAEHDNHDKYIRAKWKITQHAKHVLLGSQAQEVFAEAKLKPYPQQTDTYGDSGTYTWQGNTFSKKGEIVLHSDHIKLLGDHNRYNICAVLGIGDILNIDYTPLQKIVETFSGLEHRIEFLRTVNGITRYNDAIATTPQATIAAIKSLNKKVKTLLYGGIKGEYDHSQVAQTIIDYGVENLVLFPDTGEILLAELNKINPKKERNLLHTRSMEEGVKWAANVSQVGDVVLLSSGSPSFSCRDGFIQKGSIFKNSVALL